MVKIIFTVLGAYKGWDNRTRNASFDSSESATLPPYAEKPYLDLNSTLEDVKSLVVLEPESFLPSSPTIDIFADTYLAGLDLPLNDVPPPPYSVEPDVLQSSSTVESSIPRQLISSQLGTIYSSFLNYFGYSPSSPPSPPPQRPKKTVSFNDDLNEVRFCTEPSLGPSSSSSSSLPPTKSILKIAKCLNKRGCICVQTERRRISNLQSWAIRGPKTHKRRTARKNAHYEKVRARLIRGERTWLGRRKEGEEGKCSWVDRYE